jgi:2,3-bisphosphoglycerate-independent phosphoglycerate mutase
MKGVLVVLDGLGDLPCKELNGETPLEAARKPNINFLTHRGKLGYWYPVKEGFVPESDDAVLSLFGNNSFISGRGVVEAASMDLKLKRGDLVLRANFATIDNLRNGKILDRRAGRNLTTKEAEELARVINKNVKLPCEFAFKSTLHHRGVLVLRGGFSDNISDIDPAYSANKRYRHFFDFNFSKPLDDDENSAYTADIVNKFIEQSYNLLKYHPINIQREEKKLFPANIILTRGAGIEQPKLKQYPKWAALGYMPLEKGIAKLSGMNVYSFAYPTLRDYDIYKNLYEGLNRAIYYAKKLIKKKKDKYDYFYIHFKETDLPGHDNKPLDKKKMIEMIDNEFFSFIREILEREKFKVVVTADHSTPCSLKSHSADPIPVMVYGNGSDNIVEFNEKNSRKGSIGKIVGRDFMNKVGMID